MMTGDANQDFSEFASEPEAIDVGVVKEQLLSPPKQEDQKKEIAVRQVAPLEARADGRLIGKTLEEQYRLAQYFWKSRLLPAHYDSPEKVLTAMQLCYELGIDKPLVAMRQICVIKGMPSMWGDLPLAIVRSSGKLKAIKEYLIDKNGLEMNFENKNLTAEVGGGVCVTIRRTWLGNAWVEAEKTTVFSVDDAKFAKIWGTNVWAVYPKRMLQMRARSINLKDQFGDVLMGMAIAEYDFNRAPDIDGQPIEVESHPVSNADKLNTMLASASEQKGDQNASAVANEKSPS